MPPNVPESTFGIFGIAFRGTLTQAQCIGRTTEGGCHVEYGSRKILFLIAKTEQLMFDHDPLGHQVIISHRQVTLIGKNQVIQYREIQHLSGILDFLRDFQIGFRGR